MFINGDWLEAEARFEVTNPATGEVIGEVADGSRDHAKQAIDAAESAFAECRHRPGGRAGPSRMLKAQIVSGEANSTEGSEREFYA